MSHSLLTSCESRLSKMPASNLLFNYSTKITQSHQRCNLALRCLSPRQLTDSPRCSLRYGFVPNGGRVYYERRSQPPFLTVMVESYYQATQDQAFLRWSAHLEQPRRPDRHSISHNQILVHLLFFPFPPAFPSFLFVFLPFILFSYFSFLFSFVSFFIQEHVIRNSVKRVISII